MSKNNKDKKIVIYSTNTNNNDYIENYKNNYNNKNITIISEGNSDIEYLKQVLSKNLKKYMSKKGKNVTDLSKDIKISYSTVNDWCNGKTYPRADKIQLLANYFDIEKSDLTEKKINTNIRIFNRIPAHKPIHLINGDQRYRGVA